MIKSKKHAAADFGFSVQYLYRLLKKGVISAEPDGRIDVEKWLPVIEERRQINASPIVQEKNQLQKGVKKGPTKGAAPASNDPPKKEFNYHDNYNRARAAEMAIKAKTSEIKLKKITGEVIELKEITIQVDKIAAIIRGRLLKLPVKYAQRLENLNHSEIQETLENAMDEILNEFQELAKDL